MFVFIWINTRFCSTIVRGGGLPLWLRQNKWLLKVFFLICSSDDNTLLTGTVTVQLMGGNDPNNLIPVLTIASKIPASAKKVTFRPPKDLPGSSTYAVRVTSTVSGPHYSHMFKAGDPTIKDSPTHSDKSSESNSNSDSKDKSSSASDSHTGSESDEESSDKNSSDEEHSSNEENGTSDSETNTDTTSGASSFAATGILGIAVGAIAASLF